MAVLVQGAHKGAGLPRPPRLQLPEMRSLLYVFFFLFSCFFFSGVCKGDPYS